MAESDTDIITLRHSASHVLAQAVKELYPEVKLGIGPAIEDGFYYDFDRPEGFRPEDLEKIEAAMQKIIAKNLPFERQEVTRQEAESLFAHEPYKLELIRDLEDNVISIYRQGDFIEKKTFRLGAGKLQLYKTTIEPSMYFDNFFHGVTPGIRISQSF